MKLTHYDQPRPESTFSPTKWEILANTLICIAGTAIAVALGYGLCIACGA